MKPNLVNKKIIYSMVKEKKIVLEDLTFKKKNLLFNFFVILFFVICILILLFRYFDKRDFEKNIS